MKFLYCLVVSISLFCTPVFAQFTPPVVPLNISSNSYSYGEKYKYTIFYKSGVVDTIDGRFRRSWFKNRYFIKTKKGKIYPEETIKIRRVNIDTLIGMAYNNVWLFPVLIGKIMAYSVYPTENMYEMTHVRKDSDQYYLTEGSFKRHILPHLIADDSTAVRLWKKDRRIVLWRIFGTPAMFFGIATLSTLFPKDSSMAIAVWLSSLPIAMIPFYFNRVPTPIIIEAYNTSRAVKMRRNFFTIPGN